MRTRDKLMLERNFQSGVEYLDANPDREEAFVDWYRRIDINILQMSSGISCIIGQTLGNYGRLVNVDDFGSWSDEKLNRWAAQHGFLVKDRTYRDRFYGGREVNYAWRDEAYEYLGALWRQEVLSRQLDASVLLQAAL